MKRHDGLPHQESESRRIDRLVLGVPPAAQLARRMQEMADEGWTHREIAEWYGTTMAAVAQRLSRARRTA